MKDKKEECKKHNWGCKVCNYCVNLPCTCPHQSSVKCERHSFLKAGGNCVECGESSISVSAPQENKDIIKKLDEFKSRALDILERRPDIINFLLKEE